MPYFPQTVVLDTFNRADESPLSFGGLWTGNVQSSQTATDLASNVAKATSTTTQRAWGTVFNADQEAFVTTLAANRYDLFLRITNPGLATVNCYSFIFASGDGIYVYKVVSGSFTQIAYSGATPTHVSGDVIGARVVGTSLFGYKNGVQGVTVTDSAVTGAGQIGFQIVTSTTTADNFGGGNYVAQPPKSPTHQEFIYMRRNR